MRTLRVFARLVALCVVTATLYAVWAAGATLSCVTKRWRARWRGFIFRTWSRAATFIIGMTVHHYALVAFILRLRGFEPGVEFGVAPSTLVHWKHEALCAR